MDPHSLVVDRFQTHLALVGRQEDGPGLAGDVTRAVRDLLPPLCVRELEPRLGARAGVVRVDRIRLVLGMNRDALSATAIAEGIALELAHKIDEALTARHGAAPGVAMWADHASFAAAYIAHRLGLVPAPEWAFPDFRPLTHLAPDEAAVELLVARPAILRALAVLLMDQGGATRFATVLGEQSAAQLVDRLAAAAPPPDLPAQTGLLAALIAVLPDETGRSPGREAVGAAAGILGSRTADHEAVPVLIGLARIAVALVATERAVRADLGRSVEPHDLEPGAHAHLPGPVRDLARAWLGEADPAARSAMVAALGAATKRPAPIKVDRPKGRPAAAARRSEPPSTMRVISSSIAGVGLLMPAALSNGLPEMLSTAALHRVLITAVADEDRGARLDPLPAALAPFDPRDGEPAFPPVPDTLRALVPERFRPDIAALEGAQGWAAGVIHAFASMLPGFEASTPGYLRAQFLARPGRLVVSPDRMTLVLAPLPLGILLRHAGLHGWTGRLPQARDTILRIEVEDG